MDGSLQRAIHHQEKRMSETIEQDIETFVRETRIAVHSHISENIETFKFALIDNAAQELQLSVEERNASEEQVLIDYGLKSLLTPRTYRGYEFLVGYSTVYQ